MSLDPFAMVRSIQVQTIDKCNRRCSFCPNSSIDQTGNIMDEAVFRRIIDELSRLGYRGRLHLYLKNEPTLDKRLPGLTRVAKEGLNGNKLFISTNGDHLLPMLDDLLDAGMDEINVSCYDDSHSEILAHYLSDIGKYNGKLFFIPFGELEETFYNRGGNVDVECGGLSGPCMWLFEKMYINYNGDVILCCSDYENKVVMGNVVDMDLDKIWMCDKYQHYRRAHWKGKGKQMPLCKSCNRIKEESQL